VQTTAPRGAIEQLKTELARARQQRGSRTSNARRYGERPPPLGRKQEGLRLAVEGGGVTPRCGNAVLSGGASKSARGDWRTNVAAANSRSSATRRLMRAASTSGRMRISLSRHRERRQIDDGALGDTARFSQLGAQLADRGLDLRADSFALFSALAGKRLAD